MMNCMRQHKLFTLLVAACLLVFNSPVIAQQTVKTRAGVHADYGRLVFEWPDRTGYRAGISGKELRIVFDKPMKADYAVFAQKLGEFIGKPIIGKNGKEVRFPLRREFGLKASQFDKLVVIDLLKAPPVEKKEEMAPRAKPLAPVKKELPPKIAAANIVSERSEAEAAADREIAQAQAQENKRLAEEKAVSEALEKARTIEDEKQASISNDGKIEFDLRVKEIAGGLRMRFPFPKDVAGAVFMRGDHLWVAFDKPAHVDLSIVSLLKHDVIVNGEQLDDQDSTVLTFKVAPGFLPSVTRRYSVWQVDLLREAGAPDGILPVTRAPEVEPGGEVRVTAGTPTGPFSVIDPVVGDTLMISPVLEATQAVVENHKYVDFELLATSQGVAVVPFSDQLKVSAAPGSVRITSTSGLQISDEVVRSLGGKNSARVTPQPPAFMDFDRWKRGTDENFHEVREQLRANVMATKLKERKANQMILAQFYLAHGLESEARGVLNIMASEDANVINDPYFNGISGVTNYYLGRLHLHWP